MGMANHSIRQMCGGNCPSGGSNVASRGDSICVALKLCQSGALDLTERAMSNGQCDSHGHSAVYKCMQ